MLIFPYERALKLVDLLIDEPEGTTQQLGTYERSALAEVGNLCGSFFQCSSLYGWDGSTPHSLNSYGRHGSGYS